MQIVVIECYYNLIMQLCVCFRVFSQMAGLIFMKATGRFSTSEGGFGVQLFWGGSWDYHLVEVLKCENIYKNPSNYIKVNWAS